MNEDDLEAYSTAWNQHDIDKIMSYMTPDCVFFTGGGDESFGTCHEGFKNVKARFKAVWEELPDVRFENARHFVKGDRGCSEWTFRATRPDGSKIEIDGCDLFTFEAGKIRVKNSLVKNRT